MLSKFDGVTIRALQGVLPAFSVDAKEQLRVENLAAADLDQLYESWGYKICRFLVPPAKFTDMMSNATRAFLDREDIDPQSIDALISVSQTPDYMAPGNSFIYHRALGLNAECYCMDLVGNCSGFLIALNNAAALIKAGTCHRILILAGDHLLYSILETMHQPDHFLSDAGCVALIENTSLKAIKDNTKLFFAADTFSSYCDNYVNRIFSARRPSPWQPHTHRVAAALGNEVGLDNNQDVVKQTQVPNAMQQSFIELKINRTIQQHTISNLQKLLQTANLKLSDLGCGVIMQHSKLIIEPFNLYLNQIVKQHLKKDKDEQFECFDVERPNFFPFVLEDVGHVTSASIPLALSLSKERLPDCQSKPVFLTTFGSGFSIYSALVSLQYTSIYEPYYY